MLASPESSDARLPPWAPDLFSTPSLAEQGPAWIPSFVSNLEVWEAELQGTGDGTRCLEGCWGISGPGVADTSVSLPGC